MFLLLLILPLLPIGEASAGEKMTIGEVEEVVLMPWGVRLPARIDTGAATSSLDARELIVKDKMAEFRLPKNVWRPPATLTHNWVAEDSKR